jgi:energy-coupling factor transporter transmembrane protein EcfT
LAFCGVLLTMTTSPSDLIQGLEHLLRPLRRIRVPTQDIAVMVSMALRFVPTLLEEFDRIRIAQMARGSEMGKGRLLRRIKPLASVMVPLLVSAFRRAEESAEAMEARGYAGGIRTTLNAPRFGRNETAATIVLLVFIFLTLLASAG